MNTKKNRCTVCNAKDEFRKFIDEELQVFAPHYESIEKQVRAMGLNVSHATIRRHHEGLKKGKHESSIKAKKLMTDSFDPINDDFNGFATAQVKSIATDLFVAIRKSAKAHVENTHKPFPFKEVKSLTELMSELRKPNHEQGFLKLISEDNDFSINGIDEFEKLKESLKNPSPEIVEEIKEEMK